MRKAEDDKLKKLGKEAPEPGQSQAADKTTEPSADKQELNLLAISSDSGKVTPSETRSNTAADKPGSSKGDVAEDRGGLQQAASGLISFGAGTMVGAGKEIYNMVAGLGGLVNNIRTSDVDAALKNGDTSGSCFSLSTSLKNTGEDMSTAVRYVWNKGLIPTLNDLKEQAVKQYDASDAFGKGEMFGHAGAFLGTFFIGGGAAAKGAVETANILKAERLAGESMGVLSSMTNLGLKSAEIRSASGMLKTINGVADTSFVKTLGASAAKLSEESTLAGKMMPVSQTTAKLETVVNLGGGKTLDVLAEVPKPITLLNGDAVKTVQSTTGSKQLARFKQESVSLTRLLAAEGENAALKQQVARAQQSMLRIQEAGGLADGKLLADFESSIKNYNKLAAPQARISDTALLAYKSAAGEAAYVKAANRLDDRLGVLSKGLSDSRAAIPLADAQRADLQLITIQKSLEELKVAGSAQRGEIMTGLRHNVNSYCQMVAAGDTQKALSLKTALSETDAALKTVGKIESFCTTQGLRGEAGQALRLSQVTGKTAAGESIAAKTETVAGKITAGESIAAKTETVAGKLTAGESIAAKTETVAGKLTAGESIAAKTETVAGKLTAGESLVAKTESTAGKVAATDIGKLDSALTKLAGGETTPSKAVCAEVSQVANREAAAVKAESGLVPSLETVKSSPEYLKVLDNKAQILSTLDKAVAAPAAVASGGNSVELQRSAQQIRESLKMLESADAEIQRNGLALLKTSVEQFNGQLKLVKGLQSQDVLHYQEQLRNLIADSAEMKLPPGKDVSLDVTRFKIEGAGERSLSSGQLAARADGLPIEGNWLATRHKEMGDIARAYLSNPWVISGGSLVGLASTDAMVHTAERIVRLSRMEAGDSGLSKPQANGLPSGQNGHADLQSKATGESQKFEQGRVKDTEPQAVFRGPASDLSFSPAMQVFSRADAPVVVSVNEQKRQESAQHGGVASWRLVDGSVRYVQSLPAVSANDSQPAIVNQPKPVRFAAGTETTAPKIITPVFDPRQMIRTSSELLDNQVESGDTVMLTDAGSGKRKIKNGSNLSTEAVIRRFPFLLTAEGARRSTAKTLVRAEDIERQRTERGGGSVSSSRANLVPSTNSLLAAAAAVSVPNVALSQQDEES